MTTNFKYPLAISGEPLQLRYMLSKLEGIGYTYDVSASHHPDDLLIISKTFGMRFSRTTQFKDTYISLTEYSPECILAIAAVREDGPLQIGERVKMNGRNELYKVIWEIENTGSDSVRPTKEEIIEFFHPAKKEALPTEMFDLSGALAKSIKSTRTKGSGPLPGDYPTLKLSVPIGWHSGCYYRHKDHEYIHRITVSGSTVVVDNKFVDTNPYTIDEVNRYVAEGDWVIVKESEYTKQENRKMLINGIKAKIIFHNVTKEDLFYDTTSGTNPAKWREEVLSMKPKSFTEPIGWKNGDLMKCAADSDEQAWEIVKDLNGNGWSLKLPNGKIKNGYETGWLNEIVAHRDWVVVAPDNKTIDSANGKVFMSGGKECFNPAFITIDDVVIRDMQHQVYGIFEDNWECRTLPVSEAGICQGFKWFSTDAARAEYAKVNGHVLSNKPPVILTTFDDVSITDPNQIVHWLSDEWDTDEWTAEFASQQKGGAKWFASKEKLNEYVAIYKPFIILTTEDGVDIYKSSTDIYGAFKETYNKTKWNAGDIDRCIPLAWWFSTPDARDEYIFQNKPVLSYSDLVNWPMMNTEEGKKVLKELVQSSIK